MIARDAETGATQAVDALAEVTIALGSLIMHKVAGQQNGVRWPVLSLCQLEYLLKAAARAVTEELLVGLGEQMKIGELKDALGFPFPGSLV